MAPSPNERSPAVFLDRDGTIMRDVEYCGDPARVEIFVGAPETLRRLKQAGFKIFVITNQSGIGRGYFSEEAEVARQMGDGVIDATYFCPDAPNGQSTHRKPAPGMVLDAAREHDLDLARSFFIGDKALDAECGRAAGVQTIVVRTGIEKAGDASGADWDAADLAAAAQIILEHAR